MNSEANISEIDILDFEIFRDVTIDGRHHALLVESRIGNCTAITVVHERTFHRHIGGVRFVPFGTREEVSRLARAMTDKNILSMIPMNGQKSIVICPDGVPGDIETLARNIAVHGLHVLSKDHGVVFGPDMGIAETTQDRLSQYPGFLDHVTGMSGAFGGLAIDEHGYTAQGLLHALEALDDSVKALDTVVIQGYGAVAAHTSRLLARKGFAIKAISNVHGTILPRDGFALKIPPLFSAQQRGQDNGVVDFAIQSEDYVFVPDRMKLFEIQADVFIPAARTSQLAVTEDLATVRAENPEALDVAHYLEQARPKVIVEGANAPATFDAEAYLERNGVVVLPDCVVNSGGLVGCAFEWRNRRTPPERRLSLKALDHAAQEWLGKTIRDNVAEILKSDTGARETVRRIVARNRERLIGSNAADYFETFGA